MMTAIVIQNIYFTFDSHLTTNPMKQRLTILIALVLLFTVDMLHAQPGIPLKDNGSVLFGKDIVIHDQPEQNQRLVSVCSAFNGWLYAAYTYQSPTSLTASLTILKSTDGGITWNVLINDSATTTNTTYTCINLVTTGTSVATLKLFAATIFITNPAFLYGTGRLNRYNGETGVFEEKLFDETGIWDMSLASDFLYPAVNSNPGSLGVLYSKYAQPGDSLIFRSSSNAGMSLDNKKIVSLTTVDMRKVSLCYGRSQSYPEGRYFACWEEVNYSNSEYGNIYISHTDPYFNSPFTFWYQLDNLDPYADGFSRNLSIACQCNNSDNQSASLSMVILIETARSSALQNNIIGCFNLNAARPNPIHNDFKAYPITNPIYNNRYPDVYFNPYTSNFMATYFDSTNQKLAFLTKDLNLTNPNSWNVINPGYNDSPYITFPYPKVSINYGEQDGMNAWIADGGTGQGKAMFDAPYSTYVGASEINSSEGTRLLGAYPNPCTSGVTIGFELQKSENVRISIRSITGQLQRIVTDEVYSVGRHEVRADISSLPGGVYIYKFQAGEFAGTGKIAIVR